MALARALLTGAPDAGDDSFWQALGVPADMREGIQASAAVTPVWPENEVPLAVFAAMQTQWRVAMGGPTGLDYAALPVVMEMQQIAPEDRRRVFDDIRTMEAEALKLFSEKHGRQ